jgi:hypothetical protein
MKTCRLHTIILFLIVVGLAIGTVGCNKAGPDDQETQALAKQFIEAVYVSHDSALAMTLAVPISTYGYVNAKIVDEVIAAEEKGRCSVQPDSIKPGAPGEAVPKEVTATDGTKGITARTAWSVASLYTCANQKTPTSRTAIVVLEKVNEKWGIAKVSFDTGAGESHAYGLN